MLVIALDGAPLPDPGAPLEPAWVTLLFIGWLVLLGFLLMLSFVSRWANQQEEEENRAHQQFHENCQRWREAELEHLIDAAPGGRKPWQ